MKPQIISSVDTGLNNQNLEVTVKRIKKSGYYKDLSCILIIPALDSIPTRVVASWLAMFSPPNQKIARLFAAGMEVGEAYSQTIEAILDDPELSKFKYVVTLEHDNAPQADSLVRLLSSMENNPEYAAIGGLYFTKGPGGVAQIWGDVNVHPIDFKPQPPDPNGGLKECCGTGMGFTAFRLSMFKDKKLRRPWFKTVAEKGSGVGTQDLYAWSDFRRHGYRCAIDCSIPIGHYDPKNDVMW